tara:strand:- start:87 stop:311 length:225 start_codon:yes stop_codon:yes gene_type:complete
MVESANNRKKEELKEKIVELLRSSDNPLSTSDISSKITKAWHTIDRACLMLQIDGKVEGFKVGRMNLWKIKKDK